MCIKAHTYTEQATHQISGVQKISYVAVSWLPSLKPLIVETTAHHVYIRAWRQWPAAGSDGWHRDCGGGGRCGGLCGGATMPTTQHDYSR